MELKMLEKRGKRQPKIKFSISLDAELYSEVLQLKKAERSNRSATIEKLVFAAMEQIKNRSFEDEVKAYYGSMSPEEKTEREEWLDFSASQLNSLSAD